MYSQVQVPIPIHGSTLQWPVYQHFGAVKYYTRVPIPLLYLIKSCYYLYNNGIGTCVTYFTDSDTTKNAGIGLIPIQMPELMQLYLMYIQVVVKWAESFRKVES